MVLHCLAHDRIALEYSLEFEPRPSCSNPRSEPYGPSVVSLPGNRKVRNIKFRPLAYHLRPDRYKTEQTPVALRISCLRPAFSAKIVTAVAFARYFPKHSNVRRFSMRHRSPISTEINRHQNVRNGPIFAGPVRFS